MIWVRYCDFLDNERTKEIELSDDKGFVDWLINNQHSVEVIGINRR